MWVMIMSPDFFKIKKIIIIKKFWALKYQFSIPSHVNDGSPLRLEHIIKKVKKIK